MKFMILPLIVLFLASITIHAYAQVTAGSPFDKSYQDIKFTNAYFGTFGNKIEVTPGDKNVPFTVVFANVGTVDITGVRGQLSLPLGFTSTDGKAGIIYADSGAEVLGGKYSALTFYVNLDKNIPIRQYPGTVKIDYSRFRESGQREAFFDFTFKVTGEGILNLRAIDPFLTSMQNNKIIVEVSNTGTAPLSNVRIILQNTDTAISSTATSVTNVENVVFDQSDWSLGTVDADSSRNFAFQVYIPEGVRSDTLHTIMDITYFNAQGIEVNTKRTVDFFIKGFIDARIYNIDVIDLAGKQTVIGEVINEGNTNAPFSFVTLEPLDDSNIKKTTQFIDELETDSPVPFNIPIEFDGEPKYGEHHIKITIRYKDDLRNEHLISKEAIITLKDTSKKPTPISDYTPTIIGAIVVIAIAIFVLKKLRKKENPIPS